MIYIYILYNITIIIIDYISIIHQVLFNVNNKLFNVLNETKIISTALLVACQKCRTSIFNVIKNINKSEKSNV